MNASGNALRKELNVKKKEPEVAPAAELDLISINIGNINEGAIVDGFEIEWQKALANIADLSTPATATRAITLQVLLKPHSDRVTIETEVHWTAKFAALETSKSKVFLGRDTAGGLVAIDRDPRQMSLWTPPAPMEAPQPLEFRKS